MTEVDDGSFQSILDEIELEAREAADTFFLDLCGVSQYNR